jgi:hypothetical protein
MFLHIYEFLLSVIHHWDVLVAGTVLSAAVGVWERLQKRPIANWLFRSVIIGALVTASYFAWLDERLRIEHLTSNRISLTPAQLSAVYTGRTTSQGKELASVYIGKWTEISGVISDIGPFGESGKSFVSLKRETKDPYIFVLFESEWNKKLAALKTGEPLKVSGQIHEIQQSSLWLYNGEILELPH